jgi:hypothetical protein
VDCPGPWMIYGDFNLIYRDEEKKNDHLDRRMMGRFRRCINDLARWQVPSLLPGVGRLRPQPTSAGLRPLAPRPQCITGSTSRIFGCALMDSRRL